MPTWRLGDDKARHPDYEAKVWALGQVIAARASLDLLESRATRAIRDDSTRPWPEFAEFYSSPAITSWPGQSWRQTQDSGKPAGTPPCTWYLPMRRSSGL